MNKVFYNPKLIELARQLRRNSTKSEIQLWKRLRNKQFHGQVFLRQKPIDCYIVDFYCHRLKLVIELDGYTHFCEKTFDKDIVREKRLKELGLTVIRFTDDYVNDNIDGVLTVIEEHVLRTTHTPPTPS